MEDKLLNYCSVVQLAASDPHRVSDNLHPCPRNYLLIYYYLLQVRVFFTSNDLEKNHDLSLSRPLLNVQVPHKILTSKPCCNM
jgi:hypothetical protein